MVTPFCRKKYDEFSPTYFKMQKGRLIITFFDLTYNNITTDQ